MNGDRDERQTPPPMNDEEFAKALTPSDDSPQSQPDLTSTADDDA